MSAVFLLWGVPHGSSGKLEIGIGIRDVTESYVPTRRLSGKVSQYLEHFLLVRFRDHKH